MRFEIEITPYPHFLLFDFEVILTPLNKHPTDELIHLLGHIPISVTVHDTLSELREEEPVYLVDKNPEPLTEQFIEVLTEKQETMAADVLKQHPYPLDFQMLQGEVKEKWRQWINWF